MFSSATNIGSANEWIVDRNHTCDVICDVMCCCCDIIRLHTIDTLIFCLLNVDIYLGDEVVAIETNMTNEESQSMSAS